MFAEDAAPLLGFDRSCRTGRAPTDRLPVLDAIGAILVGFLLLLVAVVLINRNRRFLVGQEFGPRLLAAGLQTLLETLLATPEVARVTCLRLER